MTARPSFKGRTAARRVADAGSNPAGRTTPPLTLTTDDHTVATPGDLRRVQRREVPHHFTLTCDVCGSTQFVATTSDLVCTGCGCCIAPVLAKPSPWMEPRLAQGVDRRYVDTSRYVEPLHPLGTTTAAKPGTPWMRRERLGNRTEFQKQALRIRQWEMMRAVAQDIGMPSSLARAAFAEARRQPTGRGVSSAIQGAWHLYATIHQHRLPIRLASLIHAYHERGCSCVSRHTLYRFQGRHQLTLYHASQPDRLHDFLTTSFEAAIRYLLNGDNGHARETYLRAELRAAIEHVLVRLPSAGGYQPATLAGAITYAASLLSHCTVPQRIFCDALAVNAYSIRSAWIRYVLPHLKEARV